MVASHHFSRVDTRELKELIYEKVGRHRAEKYIELLTRFLTFKLSKTDFDKNCIETIGRENLSLHNHLIRAIIQNASRSKILPGKVEGLGVKVPRNSLQSLRGKCRSPINWDRKFRDRLSPLGPLGKSPSITCEETVSRIQEESVAEMQHLMNEDGEEVEQAAGVAVPGNQAWSNITAPFGVSFNTGRVAKSLYHPGFSENCETSQELPNTVSLRNRMVKKLASEGVGVSVESAKLLNHGLDVFLKRLLEPCIGLARSRCTDGRVISRQPNSQMISRFNEQNAQLSIQPSDYVNTLDFHVAMESNPSVLGPDWPIHLEKISSYIVE